MMLFARRVLLAVLVVALTAYAFDCLGMATPEQAMRCCNSMQCPSHSHHGQDCCKTMPAMHAAVGQPSSVQGISFSSVALAIVGVFSASRTIELPSVGLIAEHSHAPPAFYPPILPLRI